MLQALKWTTLLHFPNKFFKGSSFAGWNLITEVLGQTELVSSIVLSDGEEWSALTQIHWELLMNPTPQFNLGQLIWCQNCLMISY